MSETTGTIVIYLYIGFTHNHMVRPDILFIIRYMILFMRETFLTHIHMVKPRVGATLQTLK